MTTYSNFGRYTYTILKDGEPVYAVDECQRLSDKLDELKQQSTQTLEEQLYHRLEQLKEERITIEHTMSKLKEVLDTLLSLSDG